MILNDDVMVVIPARGGSKGIPKKNIRPLQGVPLLSYTIRYALKLTTREHIFLSTDSSEMMELAVKEGLEGHELRPASLSHDHASTYDVLKYCVDVFGGLPNRNYSSIVLLQPTSPFRLVSHMTGIIQTFSKDLDSVISVTRTKANPYYLLMEEDDSGFLLKSKNSGHTRRQDLPAVYEINGSIYLYNIDSIKKYSSAAEFRRVKKYEMDRVYQVDIDDELDWALAECLTSRGLIPYD